MRDERIITIQLNPESRLPIFYYCFRDFRIEENWNVVMGMKKAREFQTPFMIVYIIPQHITRRKYDFLMTALNSCFEQAKKLNIGTKLVIDVVFMKMKIPTAYHFFDFHPTLTKKYLYNNTTRPLTSYQTRYPGNVYCIDTHNIVPCWHASTKAEYSARFFRNKIKNIWTSFQEPFPALEALNQCVNDKPFINIRGIVIDETSTSLKIIGNYTEAKKTFELFLSQIYQYPEIKSKLSYYINYGIISTQEIIRSLPPLSLSKSYLDQILVRRELSDNFCFYKDPTRLDLLSNWIVCNIESHRMDIRDTIISYEDLEDAKSPDPIWNSIQRELKREGYLIGRKRMYWAKQIAYWTSNIEQAIKYAILLNDKYQLDGDCPAGIVNILWSLVGLHDRTFRDRPILGRVRRIVKKPTE